MTNSDDLYQEQSQELILKETLDWAKRLDDALSDDAKFEKLIDDAYEIIADTYRVIRIGVLSNGPQIEIVFGNGSPRVISTSPTKTWEVAIEMKGELFQQFIDMLWLREMQNAIDNFNLD